MTSTESGWSWEYQGYRPADERLRESLCTLGNGYFATRGALPECTADESHYPGTYVAGCYDRLTSEVAGRRVSNEDMVNVPNWLPLRFRPEGGTWLHPDTAPVLDHELRLVLCSGLLERRTRYDLGAGRSLLVHQLRLVHMADPPSRRAAHRVHRRGLVRHPGGRVRPGRRRHQRGRRPLPRP
ncbi:hypothetical protein GCM10020256_70960 [Streptomyces thermocoprophilus]